MNDYQLSVLKVHLTALLFGLTGVFGVLIQASSDVLVLGRLLIAFAALSVYFLWRKQPIVRLNRGQIFNQILLGALLTLHWITFYIAVKVGGVAMGTLGFASFPAFVALFEMIAFREKLKQREIVLLLIISAGLILITPQFEFSNLATQGLLWGILSGAIYGVLAVLNRKTMRNLSGTQASWWQYLVGSLLLLPFSAHKLAAVSAQDWIWIACIGLLCTSLAYTIFVSSLQHINARTASMIISLEPVYAILIAWAWLDEQPTLRMAIGGALIIGAVVLANRKK